MKQQYKLNLLAASLVTAFAANVAVAGNIQSSSIAIARETITADTQVVTAPLITYSFQGAINATLQAQTLQVQLVLTNGGTWNAAAAGSIDLYGASISSNGATQAAAVLPGTGGATQPLIGTTTTTGDTLFVTFTIPQGANNNFPTPVIRFNPTAGAVANLKSLFTAPVKTVADCDTNAYTLPVAVKHFTAVTSAGTVANGTTNGVADEHVRAGNNSTGTLLTFPTNIAIDVTKSGQVAGKPGTAKVNPAATTQFVVAADATTQNATLVNLGSVALRQQSTGYDSGLQDTYGYDTTTIGIATAVKNGSVAATASDGFIEAESLAVTVTSTQGFATGSSIYLSTTASCAAAIAGTTTATTAALTATSTITTANLAAMYGNAAAVATATFPAFTAQTVHVCYSVAGVTSAIPPSAFTASAVLKKATAGVLPYLEQNNSCSGALFPLTSGVKIDVRNYATSATNGGWISVIRLINPSEVNTATVYGQLIHSDGSYGGWGALGTLKPRAAKNMTSAEIDALLTGTPVTNGTGYVGGVVAPAASDTGDRLRITADGVGSLRVQNYLYNPDSKNFIEASSTQGVDFDGTTDRAPASEGQYQDQDAQRGLAK
jgi:hypothetical protein